MWILKYRKRTQWRHQSMQQCNVTERTHPKSINFALNLRRQLKKKTKKIIYVFNSAPSSKRQSSAQRMAMCEHILTGHWRVLWERYFWWLNYRCTVMKGLGWWGGTVDRGTCQQAERLSFPLGLPPHNLSSDLYVHTEVYLPAFLTQMNEWMSFLKHYQGA